MGTIKDRKGMDLTEADNIKKRWQEYTDGDAECLMECHRDSILWSPVSKC